MAVGLAGHRAVQAGRGPVGGVLLQGLREGPYRRREACRARVVGQQFGQVGAQGGRAARLQDDDGQAGVQHRLHPVQRAAHHRAGPVQLARGDVGEAAAHPAAGGSTDAAARRLQHPYGRPAHLRVTGAR